MTTTAHQCRVAARSECEWKKRIREQCGREEKGAERAHSIDVKQRFSSLLSLVVPPSVLTVKKCHSAGIVLSSRGDKRRIGVSAELEALEQKPVAGPKLFIVRIVILCSAF